LMSTVFFLGLPTPADSFRRKLFSSPHIKLAYLFPHFFLRRGDALLHVRSLCIINMPRVIDRVSFPPWRHDVHRWGCKGTHPTLWRQICLKPYLSLSACRGDRRMEDKKVKKTFCLWAVHWWGEMEPRGGHVFIIYGRVLSADTHVRLCGRPSGELAVKFRYFFVLIPSFSPLSRGRSTEPPPWP
jgi:hypothetical protein